MIEYSLISSVLKDLISGVVSVLSESVPGLIGAISALAGTYFGFFLTSKRNRLETLREEVCRPLMNEFESVSAGEIPSESKWDEIDTLSKHLLDQNLVHQFREYASKIEQRAELDEKISSFEKQVAHNIRKKSKRHIIHVRDGEVKVVVGVVGHGQDPSETRMVTTSLSEFVELIPDISSLSGESSGDPFKFQENLVEWAKSEECPYDNLAKAWSQAAGKPKYEFDIPFDAPIGRYQENVREKSEIEAGIRRDAEELLDELKEVASREFSFQKQIKSLLP